MPLPALFLLRRTQFSNFIIFQIPLHLSTYLERVGNYESNNEPQRTISRVAFNYEYRNLVKISLRRRYRNRIFLSFSFFSFPRRRKDFFLNETGVSSLFVLEFQWYFPFYWKRLFKIVAMGFLSRRKGFEKFQRTRIRVTYRWRW